MARGYRLRPDRGPASGFDLFAVAGIQVRVDYSWFIVFLLVTWSLSSYFRTVLPGAGSVSVVAYSALGALLMFVSVLLHEFSHSLVALAKGIPVHRITLFIFGGVSHLGCEPARPVDEVLIALAGPLASFALSLFCLAGFAAARVMAWPGPGQVAVVLAMVNLSLGLFNLVPAFPLDGGRVLRAWLWSRHGSLPRATVAAARAGKVLAFTLMSLGVLNVLFTGRLTGVWWVLIGFFISRAASSSAEHAILGEALAGTPVENVMSRAVITLEAEQSLETAVESTFLVHHHLAYPVMVEGKAVGMLSLREIKKFPRADWPARAVREAMTPLTTAGTAHPGEDVLQVLERLLNSDCAHMPVLEGDTLVGILTRRDIMDFLRLKTSLKSAP